MITKIQQYQCGDKVFKYQIKSPQINSARSVTFSEDEHESANMKLHTSKPQKNTPHSKITNDKITQSEMTKGSEEINSEKKLTPICKIYSKQLHNIYIIAIHMKKRVRRNRRRQ